MSARASGTLGLIAGHGRFPLHVARAARRRGLRVAAVALRELADPTLGEATDEICWLEVGELEGLIRFFRGAGVRDAVMAGKVPKTHLYAPADQRRFDRCSEELLARVRDRRDHSLLAALADLLEAEGIRLRPQAELVPELVSGEGPLGGTAPTAAQLADVDFAWPIAKAVASLGIGQTVVVRDRAVLAVEAIEGTDATIRRAGELGGGGACVVKVAHPAQDPRFDLPAIGLDTIEVLTSARAALLAIEAHRTVILDREAVIRAADAAGVALVGVASESAPRGEA